MTGKDNETFIAAAASGEKRIVGISSFENFPQKRIYPHYALASDCVLRQVALDNAILWLHCFKDPQNYVSADVPLLLYSETDVYTVNAEHNKSAANKSKTYDFCCYLPQKAPHAQWNNWIRGSEVAVRWLNFMADEMGLAILVVGAVPSIAGLSDKVVGVGFLPVSEWMAKIGECRYLINFSRYDASPRIIMDALMCDVPVLLNENILGGWKYINKDTGRLFFYDACVRKTVTGFMAGSYAPRKWIDANHSVQRKEELLAQTVNRILSRRYADVVDGVLFINLEDRTDRLGQITSELTSHGVPQEMVHRIDAVANDVCGHLGCTRSHIRALEYAKERGWRRYIVLEDDFVFKVPKERVLHIIAEFLATHKDDWGVFMLAMCNASTGDTDATSIKRVVFATTTSGYMVNAKYHDVLYANFVEGEALCAKEVDAFAASNPGERKTTTEFPVDQYWRALQLRDGWYTSDACVGAQSGSRSSIMAPAPTKKKIKKLAFCFS
jgi:hypothetical protein